MKISTYLEAKTGAIYLSVFLNRSTRFMASTGFHSEKKFYGTEVPRLSYTCPKFCAFFRVSFPTTSSVPPTLRHPEI